MIDLLKIEYAKVKNYSTFWVILAIYAVLVPLTYLGSSQLHLPFYPTADELFSFPTIWGFLTWTASLWNVLLGVLIVMSICNDISFKTQRQSIIDGQSRKQYILGKFYFFVVFAIMVTLYTFLMGLIIGGINSGLSDAASGIEYVGFYLIQTIGYFALAFFFAVLIRKSALTIVLFSVIIVFDIFLSPIFGLFMGDYYGEMLSQFVPTLTISHLTPFPFFQEMISYTKQMNPNQPEVYEMNEYLRLAVVSIYVLAMVFVGYLSLKRRDL
jgi:ABC-type transport system involved in multi-copper enzyme maturation permease subunit